MSIEMNTEDVINLIKTSKKKTPVKVYVKGDLESISFGDNIQAFISGKSGVLFGDWAEVKSVLDAEAGKIEDYVVENDRRNSAVPLLDLKNINARIEPGAIIRDMVGIGDNAIIMMGAVINIGVTIGEGTMIDMNAILGGRVKVGKMCHIGAGAVLAGVIEPPSAQPVVIEDDVLVGANAVILEGVRVGQGSVVAAGAVVVEDVPEFSVVAGTPARVIKKVDDKTKSKTEILKDLRNL
ncbi:MULTISPECIES: 2,3,4,5-tetrahydropyridine-2,6-dicarboxylate N-acetyltransferase [Paenibacillus]|uniref:2,3,4,5-tetrahydropyridine-2,6-dicarboxylate N-acetyltransferase n=2 Tax=Paenibacillus TaxID=44249 RepID=A0ABT8VAY8_9BACL|nr:MULTISPECIES: 2,3,4,5-tetrahydropyridine-2,6-dicarboxylate N-acetyltransferase [Paenibacillus]GMX66906.1 2,3,4,5-tetrahydropyridine-2,6-dicarboxylate N-acetyltransferase [Paenibacillus elgii]KPV57007.1 2,3,4,5-tetrahydropyridine-2,6-carboxylate N-succinyltransferase [Paenibacillus sp. A3]MBU7319181.1 2,3,4,5-tetrahydropyridine-2,6-dicarboxylate N-acetyltransferase [Paenibacillus oleatilyticus]MCP1309191.1 2,3,4,5-tetrahydropyridine-2,6-dicarboxylate N-acetyltransferase [Paenibacillus tyrfis]